MGGLKRAIKSSTDLFLFVVDILESDSTVVVCDDEERLVVEKAFGVEFSDETVNLAGVVSRKKQMVPGIEGVVG